MNTRLTLLLTAVATLLVAPLAHACETCGCTKPAATQTTDKATTQPTTKPAHTRGHHPQHGDHAHQHSDKATANACPHYQAQMHKDKAKAMHHAAWWESVDHLVAVMMPTEGNAVRGTVHFKEVKDGVHITGEFSGLNPNAKHAIHIHEFGDLTKDDGTSAGGHYNPEGHDHALPDSKARHAGDLGNLETDSDGNATLDMTVDNITLVDLENPIIGRGMIIHAKMDDGGQPTGNAGARIAYGVIGIAHSK